MRPATMTNTVVLAPAAHLDASRVRARRGSSPRAPSAARASLAKARAEDEASGSTIAARFVSLGALALVAAPAPAMAAQPIEWVFSGGSGQSIGDILKDSLEESGLEVKRDAKKTAGASAFVGEGEGLAAPAPAAEEEEEKEPVDIAGTALKFGKLGAILVFADVVTFFIMGRSVLGVMDDGGEDGWKEKMADKIMERAKAKQAADAGAAENAEETAEDDV
jgi:hypothetical protein